MNLRRGGVAMRKNIDVFVSYHIESASPTAKKVCDALERNRVRCWYCERDGGGSREVWPTKVSEAIRNCEMFLLILDQGAVNSIEVEQEFLNAWKRKEDRRKENSKDTGPEILFFQVEDVNTRHSQLDNYQAGRTMDGRTKGGGLRLDELVKRVQAFLSSKAERLEDRMEKVFRDSIHGYISVPEDYVTAFIDTPLFQRLREIEQTGMRVLYPAARHDRFVHSLGVYHLGRKAFAHFRRNVARDFGRTHYLLDEDTQKNERSWDRYQMLFEIACLLHDCGHAPFSHALEAFYDREPLESTRLTLTEKLAEQFPDSTRFHVDLPGKGAPHERMSALLVCTEYGKAIGNLLVRYGLQSVDDVDPLEFIVRAIIGCRYQGTKERGEIGTRLTRSEQIGNCLISLLNSDSIDVDSLDYIIRDARMSGVDNMSIDVDRLLNSLTLSEITQVENCVLTETDKISGTLSGTLTGADGERACFSGSIQDGMTTSGACQAELSGKVEFEGDSIRILNDTGIAGTARIGGIRFSKIYRTEETAKVALSGTLENSVKTEGAFRLTAGTDARARIAADTIRFAASRVNGSLGGRFSGELLGDWRKLHSEQARVECRLSFHKSSLSVIQNAVIARNQEYQWIFSHHKVVYHANYLIVDLLRRCVRYLLEKEKREQREPEPREKKKGLLSGAKKAEEPSEKAHSDPLTAILSWERMVGRDAGGTPRRELGTWFWRHTDADILALFKRCEIEADMDPDAPSDFKALLAGYASRCYRKSLWKSFAEMDHFLDAFTRGEVRDILELLNEHSDKEKNDSPSVFRYGYLDKQWQDAFSQRGLDDVVWVHGGSKLKELNPNETYIHFKERDVTYGSVRDPANVRPIQVSNLFYIYYRPSETHPVDRAGLIQFFRAELDQPARREAAN